MKKNDFIMNMIANNLSIFTNQAALISNIKDMIQTAEQIFDEAERQLAVRETTKPIRAVSK